MITIFSPHITNRLRYVLDFCFKQKNKDYCIIQTVEELNKVADVDINYSNLIIQAKHTIAPQGLLFESEIYEEKNISFEANRLMIDGVDDPFSLIFFWLSRYEEYGEHETDQHGRTNATNNSLVQLGLHKSVVVDELVKGIWKKIEADYSGVLSSYQFIPSFDIDVAWAYKNRKLMRTLGALAKGRKLVERVAVLSGLKKDPYDTYVEIRSIANQGDNFVAFILLGDWNKYDKNIHWKNLSYGSLIRGLNLEGEVGIHPSYASYLSQSKVKEEMGRLETITGHEITLSRQHFLRLKMPETYQVLLKCGIKSDYSMGFADQIGFRAGTSFPFYYFDLQTNLETDLVIHPFAYMDSALKDYLRLNPAEATKEVALLIERVKAVGGHFMMIWHNSSIHDKAEWKGWKAVLDFTVQHGKKADIS